MVQRQGHGLFLLCKQARAIAFVLVLLGLSRATVARAADKLTVVPAIANLPLGQTLALTANLNGAATTAVKWKVVPGGSSTVGLGAVSTSGVFTAPYSMPTSGAAIGVEAVSTANASLHATATLTLTMPVPVIASASPQTLPIGISLLTIQGSGFLPTSAILLNGKVLSTDFTSTGALSVVVNIPVAGIETIKVLTNPGGLVSNIFKLKTAPVTTPSYSAAVRFLEQSTFGPTPALVEHVQQVGFQGFLTEQFALKDTVWKQYTTGTTKNPLPPQFYSYAVNNQDQLRQRVALALSEMIVTSGVKLSAQGEVIAWQNLLLADALGKYRRLLNDVTLSPSMGDYLDMANNAKADPVAGTSPDENYAREVMQLFSIGLNKLNLDGSLQLDGSGNPIPNYNQDQIEGLSAAFTGWTYAPKNGNPLEFWAPLNPGAPMVPVESYHDTNPKQLLDGVTLPAGQTAEADLKAALDVLANDPSVGPFVCKQLIQHLVTSNPSPAYISRVATVFNKDGHGNRGNLAAVVTAILLDAEARAGDNAPAAAGAGHQREPALLLAATMRALGGIVSPTDTQMWYWGSDMGQDITNSPDVFDYFPIGYQIPSTGQAGPEFGIYSSSSAISRANWVAYLVFGNGRMGANLYSLSSWTSIPTDALLLDKLNLFFLHGQMSAGLRAAVKAAMSGYASNQRAERTAQALYTVLISPEYQVEQ